MINSAVTAISTFAQGFIQNLPTILTLAAQIIGTLAQGLISAIPQLISAIPQVVSSMIDTIMSTDWLAVGSQIVSAIGEGIFGGLSGIAVRLETSLDPSVTGSRVAKKVARVSHQVVYLLSMPVFHRYLPQLRLWVQPQPAVLHPGCRAVQEPSHLQHRALCHLQPIHFQQLPERPMTAGSSIGQSLSSGLQGSVGSINNVASTAMNGFNASLNTGGVTAVSNAGRIARNIVTAFKPAITGARTSGQTIGQNFASAISSKSGAVSGASRRLVSAVRSALSNVSTYQYGVYIGQGLANGIWSQLGNVRAAANALVAQAERAIRRRP